MRTLTQSINPQSVARRCALLVMSLMIFEVSPSLAQEPADQELESSWESNISGALRQEQAPAAAIVARISKTEQNIVARLVDQRYARIATAHKDQVSYDWSVDDDLEFTQDSASCDQGCGVNKAPSPLAAAGEAPPVYTHAPEMLTAHAEGLEDTSPGYSLWKLSRRPVVPAIADYERYGLEALSREADIPSVVGAWDEFQGQVPTLSGNSSLPGDLFSGSGTRTVDQTDTTLQLSAQNNAPVVLRPESISTSPHITESEGRIYPSDEDPSAVPEPGALAVTVAGLFLLCVIGRTRSAKRSRGT